MQHLENLREESGEGRTILHGTYLPTDQGQFSRRAKDQAAGQHLRQARMAITRSIYDRARRSGWQEKSWNACRRLLRIEGIDVAPWSEAINDVEDQDPATIDNVTGEEGTSAHQPLGPRLLEQGTVTQDEQQSFHAENDTLGNTPSSPRKVQPDRNKQGMLEEMRQTLESLRRDHADDGRSSDEVPEAVRQQIAQLEEDLEKLESWD